MQYTFHIRPALWTDGAPVTAYDFEYAWKKILDPHFPAPNAHLLYPIKNGEKVKRGDLPPSSLGIHAVNPAILKIELEHPVPYFLDLISFCVFSPVPSHLEQSRQSHRITNGPFQIDQWKHSEEMLLTKNPTYWNQNSVHLASLHISFINHEMTILHLFEKRELDLIDLDLSTLPLPSQQELAQKGKFYFQPTPTTTLSIFNTHAYPFHNVHIRRAFTYAVNRDAIVSNITQRQELTALQLVPPCLKKGRTYTLFPDHAILLAQQELKLGLEELQLEALPEITYHYCFSEKNHLIAQALQQQWLDALGVKVSLKSLDVKMHMTTLFQKNFQFAQTQMMAQYNDPMNFLERFEYAESVKNYSGWENFLFQKFLNASFFEENEEKRLDLLEKAESLLVEEAPFIPLFHGSSAILAQPYIQNIQRYKNGNPDFRQLIIAK